MFFTPSLPIAITELSPDDDNVFIGKRIMRDNRILTYPSVTWWRQQVAQVPANSAALFEYLRAARTRNIILIRDAPANLSRQPTRRWKAGGERGDHGFNDQPSRLVFIDIDGAKIDWQADPEGAVARLVDRLGEPWRSSSYVWFFTASHGLQTKTVGSSLRKYWTGTIGDGAMHVRLAFITDRALNAREAKALTLMAKAASGLPLDEKLSHRVQINYIQRPRFDAHPERDPLGAIPTIGWVKGRRAYLAVPDKLVLGDDFDHEDEAPLTTPVSDTPFPDGTITAALALIDDPGRLALRAVSPSIVTALLGPPNRSLSNQDELRWGAKGSFSLRIKGARAGFWFSHEDGGGGDILRLIQHELDCTFAEALDYAAPFVNGQRPLIRIGTPQEDAAEDERRSAEALKIWDKARPLWRTPAGLYLFRRGIEVPDAARAVLRFHPECPWAGGTAPALIALVTDIVTDEPIAIHRTAVTDDGHKIGRRTLGPKSGGAIKLWPVSSIGSELAIGEGLETALSARSLGIDVPVWSLIDAGGLGNFPVLPNLTTVRLFAGLPGGTGGLSDIERLTILADHDVNGVGQNAAARTRARWEAHRRRVRVLLPDQPGEDFNDILKRKKGLQ